MWTGSSTERLMHPTTAFIGLGSNLGDRRLLLTNALYSLDGQPGVRIERLSSLYESAPLAPVASQPWFLNGVVEISTSLGPERLLAICQAIEEDAGRVRTIHWGPRSLDLDILLHGGAVLTSPDLILPHPEILNRHFVLAPLAELSRDLVIPGAGLRAVDGLERVEGQELRLVSGPSWWKRQ